MKTNLKRLLVCVRLLCVLYGIISDCDEVFNYWEPLNFLARGFGKQTWEYAPEYAIRSWVFLLPLNCVLSGVQWAKSLGIAIPEHVSFYVCRSVIALFTLGGELALYESVAQCISPSIANWFLLFSTCSPGMSHASIAFLPSTFAMVCEMFACASAIRCFKQDGSFQHFALTVLWTALGGLLGWPFSLALGLPFAVGFLGLIGVSKTVRYGLVAVVGMAAMVGALALAESFFYGEPKFVPLNIVLYNVVNSSETSGPNIFGTEPLSYYVLNLLLNFNVVALLAYSGCILTPLIEGLVLKDLGASVYLNSNLLVILWSAIFFLQPHKEERFLYPIYPSIALSAATLTSQIFRLVSLVAGKRPTKALTALFVLGVALLSGLRIACLMDNYRAPLAVYAHIPQTSSPVNVCVGREWYHYPSSLFLPDNARLRFVPSGFRGLLPDDFNEPATNSLAAKVAALQSSQNSFNNENLYMDDKVNEVGVCDFYVDVSMPVDAEMDEVDFSQLEDWETVYCHRFIDPGSSSGIARLLYVPERLHGLARTKVAYHDYCLYQKN